jgi:hypothetical protein
VIREDIFKDLAPTADDLWFWAMAVMNDTKINIVEHNLSTPPCNMPTSYEDVFTPSGLWAENITQNDVQLQRVLTRYPEILEKIKKEADSQ